MKLKNPARLALRIGLAFSFLYAAYGSFANPQDWIGFFPQFLRGFVPGNLLLAFFEIYELALGLWLLSGRGIKYAAILSVFTVFGIIIFNLSQIDVIFRDVTILFAALALSFLKD